MRKLGFGVLGVGEMGKRHAENVRRLVPEARLIAIADVSAQRTKQVAEELEIEHAYASIEEMVQRKDIDAVLIATPDKFHAQSIRAAAAAGKDILCEKPLALDLEVLTQRFGKFPGRECACRSALCGATIRPTLPP